MPELVVIARARALEGKEEEMERALVTNAEASRGESGCISYAVLRGAGDRRLFMTHERWRSQEDFNGHMATAHVQTLLGTIGPWLDGAPEITPLLEV